jgi:hypothetical protein
MVLMVLTYVWFDDHAGETQGAALHPGTALCPDPSIGMPHRG